MGLPWMNLIVSKVKNHRQCKGDPTNSNEVTESESRKPIDVINIFVPGTDIKQSSNSQSIINMFKIKPRSLYLKGVNTPS